ncbi:MAG TPA: adenylate cyclase regulatory domain-containing protein, partial [Actinomycetota bacterium]
LTLLPVERVFARDAPSLSANDVAGACGLEVDFLDRLWRALGLASMDFDELAFTPEDVDAARVVKGFLDAGVPRDAVLQIARVLGSGMASLAAVVFDEVGTALMEPGATELDVALRWADAAGGLAPMLVPLLRYVLNLHQREEIRQSVVSGTDLATQGLPGARWITVCFVDAVGFTSLSSALPPDQVGATAQRLSDYAAAAAVPPVTLVKTIGDAAMLVSAEPDALLAAVFETLSSAEEDQGGLRLRAGVAAGDAVRRAGDWYGQPVNIASRVTARARPGSVLVTSSVRDAVRDDYRWSEAGKQRLKGVPEPVTLLRARRVDSSA